MREPPTLPPEEAPRKKAPGWRAVPGARTDVFRRVWAALYELAAGEATCVRDLALAHDIEPFSVLRATEVAARAGLVLVVEGRGKTGRHGPPPSRIERKAWPKALSVDWLVSSGADPSAADRVLRALASAGYLRAKGYEEED